MILSNGYLTLVHGFYVIYVVHSGTFPFFYRIPSEVFDRLAFQMKWILLFVMQHWSTDISG